MSWGLWVIPLLAVIFSLSIPAQAQYGGGTGEPNDPYLIYTAEQMNAIGTESNDWDKHFKLMADIDLSVPAGDSYHIIGTEDQPFEGIFDGNDHCITNFSVSGDLRIGLFGVADKGARIMNIVLVNPNVRGSKYVGTLVGELREATVVHCTTQGGTISKPSDSSGQCGFFGGLIGRNAAGIVTSCQATCDIAAKRSKYVGGLVGENMGTIQDCSATGTMGDVQTPTEYFVGALVGFNRHDKGIISGCYATGNVYYEDFCAGGLVGENIGGIFDCYATGNIFYTPINKDTGAGAGGLVGSNCGTITRCVAMGDISGKQSIGGLVGRNGGGWDKEQFIQSYGSLGFDWGNITDCYATGAVIGTECVGGLVGWNYETVSRCYATGPVSGGEYGVGGCIGMNSQMFEDSTTAGTIIACFWDIETSGQSSSAGGNGVVGKTTAEMQDPNLYLDAGWDFVGETTNGTDGIWRMEPNVVSMPRLDWELAPKEVLVRFDLDEEPNWVKLGPWQFGEPQGLGGTEHGNPDPNTGFTGSNVYGVNLTGDYDVNEPGPFYLTTDAIDCSEYRRVYLRFSRWLNTDEAGYIEVFVDVSNDSTNWHRVWSYTDTESALTDDFWRVVSYDISAIADGEPTVYVLWGYRIIDPEAYAFSGWNIDDIKLLGDQPGN